MNSKPNLFDKTESSIPVIPWILAGLANGVFVIFWILLHWGISKVIDLFPLENELDKVVVNIFSYLFAFSTLFPIIFFILKDLIVMYRSLKQKIKGE